MTSCSNAGQSAALSSDAPQTMRSHRRVPTFARYTGREDVVEEPSRATNGEYRNLRQRCAIHAARQLGLPDRRRSADKVIRVEGHHRDGARHRRRWWGYQP